jgi:hypothetical protein
MTDAWLIACTWSVRRTMLEKPQLQPQPLKFAVFASQKRAKCAGLCAERSPQRTAHCRSLLKPRICRQHRAQQRAGSKLSVATEMQIESAPFYLCVLLVARMAQARRRRACRGASYAGCACSAKSYADASKQE